MFTGIVEEVGLVEALDPQAAGARLRIKCRAVLADTTTGGSVAVNGVCLTAVDVRSDVFSADLAPETLRRTNLGDLRAGAPVNLERPLAPTGRLSGHIMQGHVDGTGELVSLDDLGAGNAWLRVRVPRELDRYLVFKGSIAIDGISLTIAALEGDVLSVTIIPHTLRATNLGSRRPGERLNLECDLVAKYVEKMMSAIERPAGLTIEKLTSEGY
jgi:riboflavin synthase